MKERRDLTVTVCLSAILIVSCAVVWLAGDMPSACTVVDERVCGYTVIEPSA